VPESIRAVLFDFVAWSKRSIPSILSYNLLTLKDEIPFNNGRTKTGFPVSHISHMLSDLVISLLSLKNENQILTGVTDAISLLGNQS
jgi:hypothetical protein